MPGHPVRVAAAVEALVVRAHHRLGQRPDHVAGEQLEPHQRVGAHDRQLGVVERAGLVQDRLRHHELADVVQQQAHAQFHEVQLELVVAALAGRRRPAVAEEVAAGDQHAERRHVERVLERVGVRGREVAERQHGVVGVGQVGGDAGGHVGQLADRRVRQRAPVGQQGGRAVERAHERLRRVLARGLAERLGHLDSRAELVLDVDRVDPGVEQRLAVARAQRHAGPQQGDPAVHVGEDVPSEQHARLQPVGGDETHLREVIGPAAPVLTWADGASLDWRRVATTTIFTTMTALAESTGAINLGQGFPDEDGPAVVVDAAVEALRAGHNQYAPLPGIPALRAAVAAHQLRYGIELDPDTQVQVTFGATEALASALLALVSPGDEVAMLDPSYDSYGAVVELAGGVPRPIPLQPPGWRVDAEAVASVVGDRTRVLLVNSPHNPTGHVLDAEELDLLADACRRHDVIALTDEVYEHLIYDGEHIPLVHAAGHGGAHDHGVVARQELRVHGLEDRLGDRSGRAGGGRARREAVPHLRRRHATPARGRAGARTRGRRAAGARGLAGRQARPACRGAGGGGLRRAPHLRHLLPHRRRASAGLRRRGGAVRAAAARGGRRGDPAVRVHRRPASTAPAPWSASPSARSARCWRMRWSAWGRGGAGPRSEHAPGGPLFASVLL